MPGETETQKLIESYETGIWYGYEEIYEHTGQVYQQMREISQAKPIIVAIGRGGWVMARTLSAYMEMDELDHTTYSVSASYINRNSPDERPVLTQEFAPSTVEAIKSQIQAGGQLWLVDAPFVTGGTMKFTSQYLEELFGQKPNTAVLHVVDFQEIESAPWRKKPDFKPDVYAAEIQNDGVNWYVQYPWEWTDIRGYNALCDAYRKGLPKDSIPSILSNINS